MKIVIIEIYTSKNDEDDTIYSKDIENVYGPFEDSTISINDKIMALEHNRKHFNTTFEIMPLISEIVKDSVK